MIQIEEARRIALVEIGPECGLVESATIETPSGWYFRAQTRAFLAAGDPDARLFPGVHFIVERADGRVFRFGSAYPAERWIANHERGFKYERYDLTVLSVSDPARALDLLDRLNLGWVAPEEAYGTVWRIPQPYSREQIRGMLRVLPCKFTDQALRHRVEVFDEIDASGCFGYTLREHAADPKTAALSRPAGRR